MKKIKLFDFVTRKKYFSVFDIAAAKDREVCLLNCNTIPAVPIDPVLCYGFYEHLVTVKTECFSKCYDSMGYRIYYEDECKQ